MTGSPVAALVPSVIARLEKSTPPIIQPSAGITIASTNAETILPKAAPITMPTAMSTTLPFIANSLNSESRLMVFSRWCRVALIALFAMPKVRSVRPGT